MKLLYLTLVRQRLTPPLTRVYKFLDRHVFPAVVAYFVHPLHIAFLIVLGVGLLTIHDTTFELVAGNYTNIGSCLVAVILLYHQQRHHKRVATHHATVEAKLTVLTAAQDVSREQLSYIASGVGTLNHERRVAETDTVEQKVVPITAHATRRRATRAGGRQPREVNESE